MRQPRQKSSNFVDESKASVREELKIADVRVSRIYVRIFTEAFVQPSCRTTCHTQS